jgi:hypothetical protein
MAKLQRSRKGEEQRWKKSLPKLVRRRCNYGEHTEGDPISQQCHGEKRRWRRRQRCRTSSSISAGVEQVDGGAGSPFSQSGGRAQETEEQRKKTMAWGKKEKFTPAALFIYRQVRVMGIVVSVPLPRPFLREVATWRHGVGQRFL